MSSILVVDDERGIRALCSDVLGRAGYEVEAVDSAAGALAAVARRSFDLILCDINLPDQDGVSLLPRLLTGEVLPAVLLITAYPSIDTAVRGMKLGARDYIGKPFSPDELRLVVRRALDEDELRRAHRELTRRLAYGSMIGDSAAMQQLRETIDKVAKADATVLITGESGTGKELVARALHFAGRRASQAFMPVNCGALVGSLLDSELFGHVRGAFTGADSTKRGLFVASDGGTLFLDEIGELPLDVQAKLLRAVETRRVRRLGGSKLFASDVRIVAATNRDLAAEVNRGNFRSDLYYRLAVAKLQLPALRERREDLPLLIEHFLRQLSVSSGNPDPRLPDDFIARANRHTWPGNVRELRNAVERAILLPNHPSVAIEAPMKKEGDSFAAIDIDVPFKVAKQKLVDEFDRRYLRELLEAHDGNISAAARAAGIERMSIYKMIRRLGLDKDSEGRAPTAPGDEEDDGSYSDPGV